MAQQRARLRAAAPTPRSQSHGVAPYPRGKRSNRYSKLTQSEAQSSGSAPAPENAGPVTQPTKVSKPGRAIKRVPRTTSELLDPIETLSLLDEFARVRERQQQARQKRTSRLHRPKRPVLTAVLSVFTIAVLIAGIFVGPVVYRGTRAYQNIFEDPVPHDEVPFSVAVNPEGTKVIVESTATTSASIPKWNGKERITMLLLGIDRREDEPTRSDTMILVNIDPVAKSASMLSIPRDLKVVIPGYGVQKINSAYAFGDADNVPGGGPGLTVRTIEANFGITINFYAQVDFNGFVKLVDTVGGVTVDVPYPIKDDEYPGPGDQYMRIFFKPGWQHMDGARALQYSRTRHDDGDGRRSARQQQVLLALREQAVSLDLLPKAAELLEEFGDAVRTDLQPTQALQLAQLGSEIDPASITSYSLDGAVYDQELPDQPYFIIADWNAVGEIMSQFTGTEIIPPMSLLANPNYAIEIRLEDGTFNPGLGGRLADVLKANGFQNVTVVDKDDLGNYPVSSITTDTNDLTTAYLIASLLGLDLDSIEVNDSPVSSPTATPNDAAVDESAPDETQTAIASPESTIAAVALFPTPTGQTAGTQSDSEPAHLVIVIGDDAPDPAYYTTDPVEDENGIPTDDGSGE